MSMFSSIVSAIFGSSQQTAAAATGAGSATIPSAPGMKPMPMAEVEAMIEKIAGEHKEKFNWKQSIVDLMKLLNLDSSLSARKQLAQELKYSGDTNDSASMNVWLHKQVMQKLADNGGMVPADLR